MLPNILVLLIFLSLTGCSGAAIIIPAEKQNLSTESATGEGAQEITVTEVQAEKAEGGVNSVTPPQPENPPLSQEQRLQAQAIYQKALAEFQKAHYDKSQAFLTEALELFSDSTESHLLLAKVLLQKSLGGRDSVLLEAAKQQVEIAVELDPNNLEAKELLELFNYDH